MAFRHLFQLLCLVRHSARAIFFRAVSRHVSARIPLRLSSLRSVNGFHRFNLGGRAGGDHNSCVTNRNCRVKDSAMMFRLFAVILSVISATSRVCGRADGPSNRLIISVRDQKLMLMGNGSKVATYPVSTSMFGLGDTWGRMTTPLGYSGRSQKKSVTTRRSGRCFITGG